MKVVCVMPMCEYYGKERDAPDPPMVGEGLFLDHPIRCVCRCDVVLAKDAPAIVANYSKTSQELDAREVRL